MSFMTGNGNGSTMEFCDKIRLSVCSSQGGRRYMEDRVNVHCAFDGDGNLDYIFVGIFDGHGGADASQFAKENLLRKITEQPGFHSKDDDEVMAAIKEGFLETHQAMRKVVDSWPRTASGFTSTSGTTASVAFIRNGKLYIGHVGDSGIVLGSEEKDGFVTGSSLTVDHKPDSPEEQRRIEDIGGEVMNKAGVVRVVWIRPIRGHQGPVRRSTSVEKIPFLAVARALGDLWSYNAEQDKFVVSPEPDVSVMQLDESHRCLIFGSDGLWNVLRVQSAVDIIYAHESKDERFDWYSTESETLETNHARCLAKHALSRWGGLRADNISVVCLVFDHDRCRRDIQLNPMMDSSVCFSLPKVASAIENSLVDYPTSVITVDSKSALAFSSKPVDLLYYGINDAPLVDQMTGLKYHNSGRYHIPGYSQYEKPKPLVSSTCDLQHYRSEYRAFYSWNIGAASFNSNKENNSESIAAANCKDEISTTVSTVAIAEEKRVEDVSSEPISIMDRVNEKIDRCQNGYRHAGDERSFIYPYVSSVDLVRRPLSRQTPAPESTSPSAEPARAIDPIPAANDKDVMSLLAAGRSCKSKKRREVAIRFASPHLYNTRQTCRTTRSGTKLSPAKSSKPIGKFSNYKARQRMSTTPKSCGKNSRNANMASRTPRSRGRLSLPIEGRISSITETATNGYVLIRRRMTEVRNGLAKVSRKRFTDMRTDIRTPEAPVFPTVKHAVDVNDISAERFLIHGEKLVDNANIENLGVHFLESLNLETPGARFRKRGGDLNKSFSSSDEMKSILTRSQACKLTRRRLSASPADRSKEDASARMFCLKRKLYFDDQALMEKSTWSKRLRGFGWALLKR